MYLRDVMTTSVITISSYAHVIDAKRLMEEHRLQRIPVVDRGKLVGIVTRKDLDKMSVTEPKARDLMEYSFSIASLWKTPVSQIMHRDVVTATPDMTVEEGVALAQREKVGGLVIVEDGEVIGIVTTNDLFYKIVNNILGIGLPGVRLDVVGGGEGKALEEIISCLNKSGYKISTLLIYSRPGKAKKNVVIHLDAEEAATCVSELSGKGYKVSIRKR